MALVSRPPVCKTNNLFLARFAFLAKAEEDEEGWGQHARLVCRSEEGPSFFYESISPSGNLVNGQEEGRESDSGTTLGDCEGLNE